MAKKPNFYDLSLQRVADHYKDGRTKEALAIVEEELAMPYTPANYLSSFQMWKAQLEAEKKSAEAVKTRTKDELLDMLGSFKTPETLEAINALQAFAYKPDDLDAIAAFLASDRPPRVFKALLAQSLIEQKVDRPFAYGQAKGQTLVPTLIAPLRSQPLFVGTVKELARLLAKNPSALSFANQYCVYFFLYVFPEEQLIAPDHLAQRIFAYTMGGLANEPVSGEFVADTITKALAENAEPSF